MVKYHRWNPKIYRIRLNAEQAVLRCECYWASHRQFGYHQSSLDPRHDPLGNRDRPMICSYGRRSSTGSCSAVSSLGSS